MKRTARARRCHAIARAISDRAIPDQTDRHPSADRRKPSTAFLAALLCAGLLPAGPCLAQEGEDAGEAELAALLAEETEIATKSRQNADYVPGIVSVLHGDEAKLLGARTALEALAMVPGIEVNRDERGNGTLRVRGVDFFFNSGNVKVMVDSLAISRETSFQNTGVLLMPIEQVDRIEVIRGPGSGLHGDFAFVGLVNIVTRHDRNQVNAGAGSGGRRSATWNFASTAATGTRISGNVSRTWSEQFDAPGDRPGDEDRRYGNIAVEHGGFSFKAAAVLRDYQRFQPAPPPAPPGAIQNLLHDEQDLMAEARYRWQHGDESSSSLWFSHQSNRIDRGSFGFDGRRMELGGDHLWQWGKHGMLAQASLSELIIDSGYDRPPPPRPAVVIGDDRRRFASFSLQDQFDVGPRLSLTGGLRYDDLEGIDRLWSPRVSALWRMDEHHALKAQYAEGFRSPHFVEMFRGGPLPASGIDFERIETVELAYVYRDERTVFRATAFRSAIDDLIFPRDTPAFSRDFQIHSQGYELEYTRQLNAWLKLSATLSDADTRDQRRTPPTSPVNLEFHSLGEASLANLALLGRIGERWDWGLHWNHVGSRAGITTPIPGYDLVNLGLAWQPPGIEGLRLRLGLRNALDETIRHVASIGLSTLVVHDYSGRHWSATLEWDY